MAREAVADAVIGEVGLDFRCNLSAADAQRDVLRRQVALADLKGLSAAELGARVLASSRGEQKGS